MRRLRGYILAEILTVMILQAGFVLLLCGSFYVVITFSSDSQQVLTARERGERVIQYVDQRIRNAGFGLRNSSYTDDLGNIVSNDSRAVREALDPLTNNQVTTKPLYNSDNLKLPVAVTWIDNDYPDLNGWGGTQNVNNEHRGNILTLLYAERNMDTTNGSSARLVINVEEEFKIKIGGEVIDVKDKNSNFLVDDTWNDETAKEFIRYADPTNASDIINYQTYLQGTISYKLFWALYGWKNSIYYNYSENDGEKLQKIIDKIREWWTTSKRNTLETVPLRYGTADVEYVNVPKYTLMRGDFEDTVFDFKRKYTTINRDEYINAWGVMAGTGVPFIVSNDNNNADNKVLLYNRYNLESPDIKTCDEILYLRCERMFVSGNPSGISDRNFCFQELKENEWEDRQPYQDGILEIYFTLNTQTNVLDLYVLASGGTDGKVHGKPAAWPREARPQNWNNSNYRYHVMYVSHASWKLENIPDGFNWNS